MEKKKLVEVTTWANVEESQVEQRVGKPKSPNNKPKKRMNNLFIQMLFTNKFIEKKKKKKESSTCGHGLLERRACGIETKTHKQAILTFKHLKLY